MKVILLYLVLEKLVFRAFHNVGSNTVFLLVYMAFSKWFFVIVAYWYLRLGLTEHSGESKQFKNSTSISLTPMSSGSRVLDLSLKASQGLIGKRLYRDVVVCDTSECFMA